MENNNAYSIDNGSREAPLSVLSRSTDEHNGLARNSARQLGLDVLTGVQFGIAPLEAAHQVMKEKGAGLRLWVRLQECTHADCDALIVASARILATTEAALAGNTDQESKAGLYQALNFLIQSGLSHDLVVTFPAPNDLDDSAWIHHAVLYAPVIIWRPAYILAALIEQESTSEIDAKPSQRAKLHPAQALALDELTTLMQARFVGVEAAGIRPHCHGFILGSSGSGKSFLARELAKRTKASFKTVTVGSWLLVGNDRPQATLSEIGGWINGLPTGKKGILFIDELDKMQASTADSNNAIYTRCCFDELLALLDGRPESPVWSTASKARLKKDVFIAAAGAFQSLYITEGEIVLEEEWAETSIQDKVWDAGILPDELLMRLAPGAVEIPPPDADWLARRLLAIDVELLGKPRFDDQGYRQKAGKMVRSRRNMRSLEAYLLETWRLKQVSQTGSTAPAVDEQLDLPDSAQN